MKKLLFLPLVLLLVSANAQTTGNRISFSSVNLAGMAAGQGGESFAIQTINGVKKR